MDEQQSYRRLEAGLIALAGIVGAGGVALAALAAHAVPSASLATASNLAIIHAGAALGIVAAGARLFGRAAAGPLFAAAILLLGTSLFTGDVAMRAIQGGILFPMAAPIGGVLLIVGWLLLAILGLVRLVRR